MDNAKFNFDSESIPSNLLSFTADRIFHLIKYRYQNHDDLKEIFTFSPQSIKPYCQDYARGGNAQELIEKIEKLQKKGGVKKKLYCASLNFSGININPFEYHDGTKEIQEISNKMAQILGKHSFKEPELSIIDKKYKKSQVSVRLGTGVAKNGKLPKKEEYIQRWKKQYYETKPKSIEGDTEEIVSSMALFEYYCYAALVCYVYKEKFDHKTEQISNISSLDGTILTKFLQSYFTRPNTSLTKKKELVMKFIYENQIDVMFIQEGGSLDWEKDLRKEYGHKRNEDSIIIYKKENFGRQRQDLFRKHSSKLNFNDDTAIFFSENQHLLISAHLTSKKHKIQQGNEMLETLNKLKEQENDLQIIVGVDANHCIINNHENTFRTVPEISVGSTSTKMRTNMQVQFHKTNVSVKEIKDQILSNKPIKNYSINLINGEKMNQGHMLPNKIHPYDHFIVYALI